MAQHLGGHYNNTAMPILTFDYIVKKYNINTVIDVGCGPGGMVRYGNFKNIYTIGIDGDTSIESHDYIIFHDYTTGTLPHDENFDLAWSTEFLEHVYEQHIPMFMDTYQKAQYVFCSAAPPGQGGHHHVNERPLEYWYNIFDLYGFDYDLNTMEKIRSTSNDKLIVKNGMFFKNRTVIKTEKKTPFLIDYDRLKKEVNTYYDICGKDIVLYERW